MKEVFHYLNLSSLKSGQTTEDSRFSLERELLVNCAGSINTRRPHKSNVAGGRADYYLIYVTEGSLFFKSCGKSVYLEPFDAIVLPPNTPYFQSLDKNGELNYLWAHFTGSNAESILKQFGIKPFPYIHKVSQKNHLQTRFQRLFDCFLKRDKFLERDLSASLEKLLIELARGISNCESPRISLSKSINYINNYYNTSIKIPDLAKMDGLSVTQYNLNFKAQMGMPPTKYIIKLRMDTAIELMASSDLPVCQIGEMCGYDDYNFFAKVFKAYTGLSPKKYMETIL